MAPRGAGSSRDLRRDGRLVVFTLAVVLLVWFVIANSQSVKVHFWVTSAEASLITVILVSASLGAIIALLVSRRRPRD